MLCLAFLVHVSSPTYWFQINVLWKDVLEIVHSFVWSVTFSYMWAITMDIGRLWLLHPAIRHLYLSLYLPVCLAIAFLFCGSVCACVQVYVGGSRVDINIFLNSSSLFFFLLKGSCYITQVGLEMYMRLASNSHDIILCLPPKF